MRRGRAWTIGLALVTIVGGSAALDLAAARPGIAVPLRAEGARRGGDAESHAARRRWALAKMDEMAQERQRCRERFKAPRQISECEAQYARRYREYNEIYLEASRE